MTTPLPSFVSMERALMLLLLEHYPPLADHPERIGGSMSFTAADDWYIRIEKVPGSRSDRLEGDFVLDVEVFSKSYLDAESRSLDIEALVLGYPHVVEVDGRKVVIDQVSQNTGPASLPWEDDEVSRLGATYVLTARRR